MYNNHFELELIEPPNKDGYLGSFHEIFFFYFIRPVHSRHYKEHESTFHVKRDFFTQFLDRSNWENHWSHCTFDFRTTSGLLSLVRCIDLKVFRLSLINYNTFLFHSALVNHYIAKSATLIKGAVFTGWRCERLLVFLSIRTDHWAVLRDYSCHQSILYSFGCFKRANFKLSIIQQNVEFDNWHPFNFTYLFCNLFSRVNLAFVYCKTFRKIVWGIFRRQLLSTRLTDFDHWLMLVYAVYRY